MNYLYIGVGFIVLGLIGAVLFARTAGIWLVLALGVLGTILTGVLFWLNKSDSVDDTLIEQIATATPPLISFSIVIGWWLGYAIMRWWSRR